MTANDATSTKLDSLRKQGVDMSRITVSSDAYGSFPVLDDKGCVVQCGVGKATSLLHMIRELSRSWQLSDALPLVTANVARVLQLENKGKVQTGQDADVLVLDSESLTIRYAVAMGEVVKGPDGTKRGMFE